MNQLEESESPVIHEISEIKWCRKDVPKSPIKTRDKWYETYSVPNNSYVPLNPQHIKSIQNEVDKVFQVGDIVSAIDAVNHVQGSFNVDTRPKIFDNKSKTWVLLDTGSCVSCLPATPEDKVNESVKLRSVNGGTIDTFGTRQMTLRIGRKEYHIEAMVAAVPSPIFGWDIFQKYRLALDWNTWGDLILLDKKAAISTVLRHEAFKANSIPRIKEIANIQSEDWEARFFEIQCMKHMENFVNAITLDVEEEGPFVEESLPLTSDPEYGKDEQVNLNALKTLDKRYVDLILKYPGILKNTFKTEPKHKIFHKIDTMDDKPVTTKVRPLLASSEKSVQGKAQWEEMEKMGVIERVHPSALSEYSSALHLVKKPSGHGWRVCVDFRPLNNKTKSESYPLPKLKSFTEKLKGAKWFSKIDLRSAFWNLAIHPDSINKTMTLSPWGGAFVFKRLPFGLKNGPQAWMKFLNHVLSGIDGIFAYLDDLLVWSDNQEDHDRILQQIFERLQENGLALALDKCVFAAESVEYLGFQVTSSGMFPLKRKVDAVYNIPQPTTQKELLRFLGALNYFRSNLSGLVKHGKYHNTANLLQPLYAAATVKIPSKSHFQQIWKQSPILQEAFLDAKKLLINATKLGYQDPNLPLALYTDASEHSVGAVLIQFQNGKKVPLGYYSRHLPVEKSNWAVYRKELEAARSGLRYFINEIYGRHCVIYSDHLPLVNAWKGQGFQLHDPVAQRALLEISQFTKDIRHVSGVNNCGSDYFSRLPPPDKRGTVYSDDMPSIAVMEGHKMETVSPQVVSEAQEQCEEVSKFRKSPSQWGNCNFGQGSFSNVELFCELSSAHPRPFLPKPLRHFVMTQLHSGLDHPGLKESKRRISMYYYWPTIKEDIDKFVRSCHGCQSVKPSKQKPPHIGTFDVPDDRFSHIHIDIVGPLPPSKGYKYILSIKDRSTRFVQAIPLVNPTSENIAEAFMLHWASLFGLPSICTSDQGANLTSGLFRGLQDNLGIQVNYSPIYYPQSNGMIERSHQSIKNSIKAKMVEMGDKFQDKWIYYLPWVLLGIRSAFNHDLQTSSAEMTFGKHVQLPGTLLANPEESKFDQNHTDVILQKLQLKNNRIAVPTSYNRSNNHVESLPDTVTHVYARQHDVKGLSPRFIGPFPVTSRPSRSTIEIKVGLYKNGTERREIRHLTDIKVANMRDDTVIAERPKLGRPSKSSDPASNPENDQVTSRPNNQNKTHDETKVQENSPNLAAILPTFDFSVPPPPVRAGNSNFVKPWAASKEELQQINNAISARNKA